MSSVPCPLCQAEITLDDLVQACTAYVRATRVLNSRCPHCARDLEVQWRGGKLTFGYTYWAGDWHFEGVVDHPAAGCKAKATDAGLLLTLHGQTRLVPVVGGAKS